MKKPETIIEESIVSWAEGKGIITRKLSYEGRNGAPDRIFFYNKLVALIEFKKPGGKIKPHQFIEIESLAGVGVEVPIIDSLPAGVIYLKKFFGI